MKVLDLRLAPVAGLLWVACAVGLHLRPGPLLWIAILLLVLAGLLGHRWRRWPLWWCVTAGLGLALAALRVDAADPAALARVLQDGRRVTITAVVDAEPRVVQRPGYGGLEVAAQATARATLIGLRKGSDQWRLSVPVVLQWPADSAELAVGQTITAAAALHPGDAATRTAYWVRLLAAPRVERSASRGAHLATVARGALAEAVGAEQGGAGATLLPGLVLGDTRFQSPALADDLRRSGLSHLSAVSGANIAIVLGAVVWLLQRLQVRAQARRLLAVLVLAGYVVVVQPQPSVLRAAVMGALSLLALSAGVPGAGVSLLWATVVLLLVIDPFLAWQWGFALSVAATVGLLLLLPRWRSRLPDTWWGTALAVTVAAQAATLPVLLAMGAPPTWASIPANVLAEPLVAPATLLGFLASVILLLGQPWDSPALLESLAAAVAWPAVRLSDAIAAVAHAAASGPLAVAPIRSPVALVLVMAVVGWMRHRRVRRRTVVALCVAAAAFTVVRPEGVRPWPGRDWAYAQCDVGQGDATVLGLADGTGIVVDAGPDPDAVERCLRQLGIRRIRLLVLTHYHADHVEGLPGLLRRASVDAVIGSPLTEPAVEHARVRQWLGREPVVVQAGAAIRVGGSRIDVLWPAANAMPANPNDASVVLQMQHRGLRLLLTGDIGAEVQEALDVGDDGHDLLKVPHHGSADRDAGFLARVSPRLSVVSVGEGNDYGHPAATTVDDHRRRGIQLLRTDQAGSIAVARRGDGLLVRTLSG